MLAPRSVGLSCARHPAPYVGAARILHRLDLARCGVGMGAPNLATPTYFPAVSSTCSLGPPEVFIRLLTEAAYPRALVSAYDCKHRIDGGLSKAAALLSRLQGAGCTVLLDSGLFECQVLGIEDWSADNHIVVASALQHDLLLSYDGPVPASGARGVPSDGKRQDDPRPSPLLRIIHGRNREAIVGEARLAVSEGASVGIAIPDRECGPNLLERMRTVCAIRRAMNHRDELLLLHILGCGNPVVMSVYALAGADSYDSLDWVQGAVDIRTLTVTDPVLLPSTGCKCRICVDLPGPDRQRAVLHNLLFYQDFGTRLRGMIRDRTVSDFLQEFLGKERTAQLVETANEGEAKERGTRAG